MKSVIDSLFFVNECAMDIVHRSRLSLVWNRVVLDRLNGRRLSPMDDGDISLAITGQLHVSELARDISRQL